MTAVQQWLLGAITASIANGGGPPPPPTIPPAQLNFLDNFSNAATPWLGTFVDDNGGYPASHLYGPWRDDLAATSGTASQAAGVLTVTYDGSGDPSPLYEYQLEPTSPMYIDGNLYLEFTPLSAGTILSGQGLSVGLDLNVGDYVTMHIGASYCSVTISIDGTTVNSGLIFTDNWASLADDLLYLELTATTVTLGGLSAGTVWTTGWTRPALPWNVSDVRMSTFYGVSSPATIKLSGLTAFIA